MPKIIRSVFRFQISMESPEEECGGTLVPDEVAELFEKYLKSDRYNISISSGHGIDPLIILTLKGI